MPIDERTYRRNSRSTQTDDLAETLKNTKQPKRRSLLSSVVSFVTNATTTASLEFDRLCESIGLVNRESDSEYEYEDVTDESVGEGSDQQSSIGYGDSEIEDLDISPKAIVSLFCAYVTCNPAARN